MFQQVIANEITKYINAIWSRLRIGMLLFDNKASFRATQIQEASVLMRTWYYTFSEQILRIKPFEVKKKYVYHELFMTSCSRR